MSTRHLETLLEPQGNITELEPIAERLTIAVENFIGAAHDRLVEHQTRRNLGWSTPYNIPHVDAYLLTRDGEAVIRLTSLGAPEEMSQTGLFIKFYADMGEGITEIVNILTAKTPMAVQEYIVRPFTVYTTDQVDLMTEFILEATPLDTTAINIDIPSQPTGQIS